MNTSPLSKEVLSLLTYMERTCGGFDSEFMIGMMNLDDTAEAEQAEGSTNSIFGHAEKAVQSILNPAGDPSAVHFLHLLQKVFGNEPLDEYFTRRLLCEIPHYVKRLRRLEAVGLPGDPGHAVTRYFRQASSCYVFGFYDAVAILSRAVLEAALESSVGPSLQELPPNPTRQLSYLERLIRWASMSGKLDESGMTAAQQIRRLGNGAVHIDFPRKPTSQPDAQNCIKHVVSVLRQLYGE